MKATSWARSRGFTLVELMVVVVLVGVLATLGLVVLGKHTRASRAHDTVAMIQSIRVAQERWRAENLQYLDVSVNEQWFPRDPTSTNGDRRVSFLQSATSHSDGARWIYLNPTSNPMVYGGFMTRANMARTDMWQHARVTAAGISWPAANDVNDAWYVIQAVTDYDMDGRVGYYLASSITGEVYRRDELE